MAKKYKAFIDKHIDPAVAERLHPHSINRVPPKAWGQNNSNKVESMRHDATTAAKIILDALWSGIDYNYDPTVRRRLTDYMRIKRLFNPWYLFWVRRAKEEDIKKLIGFQFNVLSPLEHFINVPFEAFINQEKNQAKFSIPSFVPSSDITWPAYNSIARIRAVLTGINLQTGDFQAVAEYSSHFTSDMTDKCSFEVTNKMLSTDYPLLIYSCGINYYQPIGTKKDAARILDIKYNPMDVVAVEYSKKPLY